MRALLNNNNRIIKLIKNYKNINLNFLTVKVSLNNLSVIFYDRIDMLIMNNLDAKFFQN